MPVAPDQIVQKIAVTGQPDTTQLDAAGLHVTDFLDGPSSTDRSSSIERRSGDGSIAINGDLTLATLAVDPLAWTKPSGNIANASAILLMSHDRLTKIDRIAVRGDGLLLTGSADVVDGHVRAVRLDTIRLGRRHGARHDPSRRERADRRRAARRSDRSVRQVDGENRPSREQPDAAPVTTPDWTLDARFDHAILANGERRR